MEKEDILLATLYAYREPLGTVQIQKLLFLVNEGIAPIIGNSLFDFQPYTYGPFDKTICEDMEQLAAEDKVEITTNRFKIYRLTESGKKEGKRIFATLPQKIKDCIKKNSKIVKDKSFGELVSFIYQQYPEMRYSKEIA